MISASWVTPVQPITINFSGMKTYKTSYMLRFTIGTRPLTLIAMELSMVIVKWGFPSMGDPKNGWFLLGKIPLKWMIWGYPYFRKPPNESMVFAVRFRIYPYEHSHVRVISSTACHKPSTNDAFLRP